MSGEYMITGVADYEPYVGAQTIERLIKKAKALQDLHVVHVNSTYYGGGVAELLSSMTLLLNNLGIKTGWRIIFGPPDFFRITKGMHNAIQGGDINLSDYGKKLYEIIVYENSIRMRLDHDIVVIHDPQPLPLINHYRKKGPWIWRCHVDLSNPNRELWDYLKTFIEKYDAVIVSIKEYAQQLKTPQLFFMPAIDPFATKNRDLGEEILNERLKRYDIPTDLPLVVQISRFDRWKDPEGVIKAFNIARREVDCTLVLLGNVATDDPEGQEVFESMLEYQDERIIIRSVEDAALVNALQRRAAVVLQKSIREGFGLTVTEAMWKGTPVIGGKVGGIPSQIQDGVNGFLVTSIEEAADRIVRLLKDEDLRQRMGREARETVRKNFLLIRLVEQYLDLFSSFEPSYRLKNGVGYRQG
ncbi:glycosyltransferase [Desulfoscipio geothermicus]|uniref:Trehalose synthase (ADP-glucose) n=1 Tax=Desulfoscipio geothermicus DSM 3669 TaxID=1121426 RepID=A0A1I6DTI2_9FIRM|nr:glycosyltransferase [Desulfoscipio geothermicus]SFR08677.1 trehalose synthase (ADP-glucose) [Desulfoscipio geothermicus DSM 3669]